MTRIVSLFACLLPLVLLMGCGTASVAPDAVAQATALPPTEAPPATATTAATNTPAPTATPAPTETPAPTATPEATATAEPTPTPEGLTKAQLAEIKPNELGWALVMEWHLIEPGEDSTYNRTPGSFRADLEWLYENDYYPIRFRDLSSGDIDIPAGKSPVVLTFDDSSDGQFRYLEDGTIDPNSGMGILLAFSEEHPDFPPIATFFVLLDVDMPSRILFGQPEWADEKLRTIVELGGEVGSHTVSHQRLDAVDDERVQWQLALSAQEIAERIGDGYEVVSLALPLGIYPNNGALLQSGESEGMSYRYTGAAEVGGGATVSPYSTDFDPYHINRAQAVPGYIDNIFYNLGRRPILKYISDGDPETLTIPTEETLAEEHQGTFDESQWPDMKIVRYERPPDPEE